MKPEGKQIKQKKKMIRDWLFLGITIVAVIILLLIFPAKTDAVTSTVQQYFIEMMIILPAVMVIMGLFAVFISMFYIYRYYFWPFLFAIILYVALKPIHEFFLKYLFLIRYT